MARPITLRTEIRVAVPPVKACDWWFDLQEDDHDTIEYRSPLGAVAPGARRILDRRPGEVEFEEHRQGRRPWRGVVRREGNTRIVLRTLDPPNPTPVVFDFLSDGDGCRIVAGSSVEPPRRWAALFRLFAVNTRAVDHLLRADMELHKQQMEREWAAHPW